MTYNLFFKNKHPLSIISLIKSENPDVLFVQELTPQWNDILNSQLKNKYKYQLATPLTGTHGIGVYSKYPLRNKTNLNNDNHRPYAQVMDMQVGAKTIQLINVHLASPAIAVENREKFLSLYNNNYQTRKKQLQKINQFTQKKSETYSAQLLIGDLNTLKYEPIFKNLKRSWANSFDKSGSGFGFNFPNSSKTMPLMTLDYILGRGEVKFLETRVVQGGSSDHLAIISKLKI